MVTSCSVKAPSVGRSVFVACSGHVVEWFDFFAYAFAAIHFAAVFFPSGDSTSQLLKTMGIFGVGFLMRPLGAWYFGRMADREGRRIALVWSISLMGLGSLLIAILPTFMIRVGVTPGFASFFGGTSLLIVVGVALDTLQQVESHLLMRHYDGFMKSGKLRGRRGF